GNDMLGGEVRTGLDLLVCKWPAFGRVDDKGTNQLVLPAQGHSDKRASAAVFGRRTLVPFYRCVRSVDELFCLQKAIERSSGSRLKRPALLEVLGILGICRRHAKRGSHVECAVITIQHTKRGLADANSVLKHSLE